METLKPKLPREFLWTDKNSMEEFFELDPVNKDFYDVLHQFHPKEKPMSNSVSMGRISLPGLALSYREEQFLNEAYYQITRMVYEQPTYTKMHSYFMDVKATIGWSLDASMVMAMIYFLMKLMDKCPIHPKELKAIVDEYGDTFIWKPFEDCYERLKERGQKVSYQFKPCLVSVDWFATNYVNWSEITYDFNHECMEQVVRLWSDERSQRIVARIMFDFLMVYKKVGKGFGDVFDYTNSIRRVLEDESNNEDEEIEIEQLKKKVGALEAHIVELEAEKARLTTLLDKKKNATGKNRKFTLMQIVDYCMKCVEWRDVQTIVAMLNKMIRNGCTQEDSDLVDSIESEFRQRMHGNAHIEELVMRKYVNHEVTGIENGGVGVVVNPKEN
jgi:hypothetical protein